jgi:ribosomal protein S18 acetylase RimI-like enzyme
VAWPVDRIDVFCDAVPRDHGRTEVYGPLTLFVRVGAGWPYYARPTRGARDVSTDHVCAVRARQRALGLPESFEWIDELTPSMRQAAKKAGLRVISHPLMVLSGHVPPGRAGAAGAVRMIGADDPELARMQAVQMIAFGAPGMAPGPGDTADRDVMIPAVDPTSLELVRDRMRRGRLLFAAGFAPGHDGPVAVGGCQVLAGVAEIVGVGTLPVVRRRGLATAVTARLGAAALARGAETVFLSAADEQVARMYERLGFLRVGTSMVAGPAAI